MRLAVQELTVMAGLLQGTCWKMSLMLVGRSLMGTELRMWLRWMIVK